jgi:MFS family permease
LVLYGATVFLSSGVLLVLEITAGRLIAPYVGVSLYTWTSVIGVILAGLSLGNWLGGVWVDRGAAHGAAGATLALAGLASLSVLLVLTLVAPLIQTSELDLLSASFLFVASLFFIPALLLGVITPLLTTLALGLDERSGHVVGRMHALAALGSIAGTFVAGYWLIQSFGTRTVLIVAAVVLFLLAIPFLLHARRFVAPVVVVLAAVVVALTHLQQGFANPCDRESQYYCLRVEDASLDAPFGTARALVLDHLVHGINHESEAGMLISPYLHLADELAIGYFGPESARARYFFAGGGAYTYPRAVRSLAPDAQVTVAEIDPVVTQTAVDHLYVSTDGMQVRHMDARVALQRMDDAEFDVVVSDVFQDLAIPYHLTTVEFVRLVKSRMSPRGLYIMNVLDAYPDPQLVKAIVKTLGEVFRYVHVWLEVEPTGPERVTYVVSATDSFDAPTEVRSQRGFERHWQRMTNTLLARGTPMESIPMLTDDYVPVERLVGRLLTTDLSR